MKRVHCFKRSTRIKNLLASVEESYLVFYCSATLDSDLWGEFLCDSKIWRRILFAKIMLGPVSTTASGVPTSPDWMKQVSQML